MIANRTESCLVGAGGWGIGRSDVVLAKQNQVSVLVSTHVIEWGQVVGCIVPWPTALEDWTSCMAENHQRVVRWDSQVLFGGC